MPLTKQGGLHPAVSGFVLPRMFLGIFRGKRGFSRLGVFGPLPFCAQIRGGTALNLHTIQGQKYPLELKQEPGTKNSNHAF